MFTVQFLNAQCPSNKVYACRNDACGFLDCKCINASQVAGWTATIPPCQKLHFGHGGTWRIGENESEIGIVASLQVYPNPISNSTSISFSLEQAQIVSMKIFDLNGRLVSIVTDQVFNEGDNEFTWNVENLNGGIYFLQFDSEKNQQMLKLVVTK